MPKLTLIFILCALNSFAMGVRSQTGSITGKVTDSVTHEALIGATVYIENDNSKGALTDVDGNFTISDLRSGTYNLICKYISYRQKTVKSIVVSADKVTAINIEMASNASMISEVTVKEARITNTENAVISEMKKTDNVMSGISYNQIAKSQDRDAGDVVKRIPGVTVLENRFIMVRGLNDRYNNVWLNDAGAPSSETDKKSFSFDVIPSGLIDRILIYKTPSPELPGDFAGGMVKIYTKSFPSSSSVQLSLQSSFRAGTTFNTMDFTQGSSSDWLGYDNGFRNIPPNTPNYISKNDEDNATVSKSFQNTWGILHRQAIPDLRLNLYYTGIYKVKNTKIGSTFALIYANVNSIFNIHRQDWDSVAQVSDYSDVQSTNAVRTALLGNVSFLFKNTTIEFKNFLNQNGIAQTTVRNSNLLTAPNQKYYVEDFEERTTFSSQLAGTYKSPNEKTQYNWTLGYDYSFRNEPDLRRIKYSKQQTDPDSLYKAQVANVVDPVNGGGRFFSMLNENTVSFDHNLKQQIRIGTYKFELNVGNYLEYKYRWFWARVLGYTIAPGQLAFELTHLPIDQIFDPENVGIQGGFHMDEITSPSDKYTAENKLFATYASFTFPIGQKIKIVTGARYEYNVQALQSYVNLDSVSPSITTKFLLPSLNASYNINQKSLVRLAYGKTLNRPEFREWAPFYFYDFEYSAGTYGSLFPTVLNPQGSVLDVAQIQNFDARYEWYPSTGEVFQFGLFYKSFDKPIQRVILNSGGSDSKAFTFVNAENAYASGIEVDARKNLSFISKSSQWLSYFNVVGNASLIRSQVKIEKVINQTTETPMQGQSPYVINAGVYFQDDSIGFQASLLYNVFGPRIYLIGTLDYANIGEMPQGTLDLTISKNFGKYFSLNVALQNLLDPAIQLIQDTNRDNKFQRNGPDKEIQNYRKGRYYSIGAKIKF